MTDRRRELIRELTAIQNDRRNWNRDILSFAGFMDTDDELAAYVERHRAGLAREAA